MALSCARTAPPLQATRRSSVAAQRNAAARVMHSHRTRPPTWVLRCQLRRPRLQLAPAAGQHLRLHAGVRTDPAAQGPRAEVLFAFRLGHSLHWPLYAHLQGGGVFWGVNGCESGAARWASCGPQARPWAGLHTLCGWRRITNGWLILRLQNWLA